MTIAKAHYHRIKDDIRVAPLMPEQQDHVRMFEFKHMKRHRAHGFFAILTEVIEELLSKGKK